MLESATGFLTRMIWLLLPQQMHQQSKETIKTKGNMLQVQNEGHYANECDQEDTVKTSNKYGSNFLILKNNQEQYRNIEEGNEDDSEDDNVFVTVGSSDD